jgi:hypothetical protein
MRNYRTNAGSPVRLDYGTSLVRGLSHFEETRPLADPFAALNGELEGKYDARRKLRRPLLEARQDLRFADYDAEQAIRLFVREAEIADGGRRGLLTVALVPRGVTPLVAPFGPKQVQPLAELIERLENSRVEGADALRAAELPKLQAARTALETAVEAYDAARKAYLAAFAEELAVRDDHRLAVDKLMGQVRATFPGDRVKQDLIVPDVQVSRGRAEDPDDDDDPSDAGPAA